MRRLRDLPGSKGRRVTARTVPRKKKPRGSAQPDQRPREQRLEEAEMRMRFGHGTEMRTNTAKGNSVCPHLGARPQYQLPGTVLHMVRPESGYQVRITEPEFPVIVPYILQEK